MKAQENIQETRGTDILSLALNKSEQSGRVRGVGGSTTLNQYWGKPSQTRRGFELQTQLQYVALVEKNKTLEKKNEALEEKNKALEKRIQDLEAAIMGPSHHPEPPLVIIYEYFRLYVYKLRL